MIFIDCSIPRSVADRLKQQRSDVIWLGERFNLDAPDKEWLEVAGENGWLVITHDKKIRTRPDERRTLIESGVGCFILVYKENLSKHEIFDLVSSTVERMEEKFNDIPRPFICTVDKNGTFRAYSTD